MICNNCGKEIKDGAQFCNYCGTQFATDQRKKAQKKKGSFLLGLISGIIAIALIGGGLYLSGVISFTKTASHSITQSQKLESDGFTSPEKAVEEYLNAFKNKDLNKMISCFAIESYVETYDAQAAIESMKLFQPMNSSFQWPDLGALSQEMNIKRRESGIFSTISNQYIELCTNADSDSTITGYRLNDYSDYYEFLSDFVSDRKEALLSSIKFNNEFVSWNEIADTDRDKYIESREKSLFFDGAKIEPVFAKFYIDNQSFVLAIDTVQYNGKWYLYAPCLAFSTENNCGIIWE